MRKFVELKFHIDAFSPETIPMRVLAEFLVELSTVLGQQHAVHFDRLEPGSTVPVLRVDYEAAPAVVERVHRVKIDDAPNDALEAKRRLERKLVQYNAKNAELFDDAGARILLFRGKGAEREEVYGPIRQAGELIGTVEMIGGKNDPVPVHIKDGARTYTCVARREVAIRVKPFLLTDELVRVTGDGKHYRNDQGVWELQEFTIRDCERLDGTPFGDVLQSMRAVKGDWLAPSVVDEE